MEVWRGMQEGLDAVIVNPGIILGEGSPIGKILDQFKKGLRWYTSGTNALVGIQDVIEVMNQLMHSKIKGERFVLVAENWEGKALASHLIQLGGHKKNTVCIPKGFMYFLWALEHFIQILGIRKRFLTRAMINSQYERKNIDGEKIKSYNTKLTICLFVPLFLTILLT